MRFLEPFPAERFYRARIFLRGVATREIVEDFDVQLREYRRIVVVSYCAPMPLTRYDVMRIAPLAKLVEKCQGHHNDAKATCGRYGRPNVRSERRVAVYDVKLFVRHANDDGEFQLHFREWQ